MSDDFEFDAPEEVSGGGNFLAVPGTYHFQVNNVRNGQGPKGNSIAGFTAEMTVLAGTDESQKDHTINLTFFNGNLNHKDQGEFARKKQAAFFIAANAMDPNTLGQKGMKVDLSKAVGAQVIATLELDDQASAEGKTFLRLAYANIYHVDDPRAKAFPRMQAAIDLIPQQLRRPESFFEKLLTSKPKAAAATAAAAPGLTQSQLDAL